MCASGWVSAAARHFWLGFWGVCVLVCVLRLYPATPGWDVRRGCCAWAAVSATPRHSWLECWGVCVLVCALGLYPATPGWGVRCGYGCLGSAFGCAPPLLAGVLWCVCSCSCSPCTPPLLAGVCGVRVCVWARVSAAPRHSWPGCWGVCVVLRALPLYPATPGWGVRCRCGCLGSGVSAAPRHYWLWCWGVRVGVRAPPVPRHSWLGCAAWVCVLGLWFWLRPATPGQGVWGVCALVCALRLSLVFPGWGVRCGCVFVGSGFGCAPPLLAGVLGCVCWCACSPCNPPPLVGVCGVGVCAWSRVSAATLQS